VLHAAMASGMGHIAFKRQYSDEVIYERGFWVHVLTKALWFLEIVCSWSCKPGPWTLYWWQVQGMHNFRLLLCEASSIMMLLCLRWILVFPHMSNSLCIAQWCLCLWLSIGKYLLLTFVSYKHFLAFKSCTVFLWMIQKQVARATREEKGVV
jgi:hypothetical protein